MIIITIIFTKCSKRIGPIDAEWHTQQHWEGDTHFKANTSISRPRGMASDELSLLTGM